MPRKQTASKLGRPATGKRSNPEYRQTSLWLRRETLAETMRTLVTPAGDRVELSQLVQALLERWIASGAKLPK